MVGRGAHEGQSERHVDALLEGERLERHERLVVIHADGRVVGRAGACMEQRIGRMRPGDVEALRPRRFDRRRDDVDLLAAQASVFAGMRVEAGDGKARAPQAEIAAEIARRDLDGGEDQILGQQARDVLERDVDGDRHHFERGACEHHHRMQGLFLCRGESGEIFGVSREGEAGAIEHGLGDGVGHDGACRALLHEAHGALDRLLDRRHGGLRRDARPRLRPRPRPAAPEGPAAKRPAAASASAISAIGTVRPSARARSASTAASPSRTKGGIVSCVRASQARSVMSGPIPAGSPRVSAKGRSAKLMAFGLARKAPLAIFDEGLLTEIAQQPLGAERHFLVHQLALRRPARASSSPLNERLPQTA